MWMCCTRRASRRSGSRTGPRTTRRPRVGRLAGSSLSLSLAVIAPWNSGSAAHGPTMGHGRKAIPCALLKALLVQPAQPYRPEIVRKYWLFSPIDPPPPLPSPSPSPRRQVHHQRRADEAGQAGCGGHAPPAPRRRGATLELGLLVSAQFSAVLEHLAPQACLSCHCPALLAWLTARLEPCTWAGHAAAPQPCLSSPCSPYHADPP